MRLFGRKKAKKSAVCSVIVVAAGVSSRMGEDKVLMELGGVPVIIRALQAFESVPGVAEEIVVTREELVPEIARLCQEYGLAKVSKVIRGGNSRIQSARLGTLEADGDLPLIAIHDGARPFVSAEVIESAIVRALETGAAAPAVPVKDTIKLTQDGLVERTLDRSRLFAVQTPQVFDSALIRAALQKALEDGAEVTDDCAAVERLGMKVSLVRGDERNIKLTTPFDLQVGACILDSEELI